MPDHIDEKFAICEKVTCQLYSNMLPSPQNDKGCIILSILFDLNVIVDFG